MCGIGQRESSRACNYVGWGFGFGGTIFRKSAVSVGSEAFSSNRFTVSRKCNILSLSSDDSACNSLSKWSALSLIWSLDALRIPPPTEAGMSPLRKEESAFHKENPNASLADVDVADANCTFEEE